MAIFVFSVITTALGYVLTGSMVNVAFARQRQVANHLATQAMEQVRALPFSTLAAGLDRTDLATADPNITVAGSGPTAVYTFTPHERDHPDRHERHRPGAAQPPPSDQGRQRHDLHGGRLPDQLPGQHHFVPRHGHRFVDGLVPEGDGREGLHPDGPLLAGRLRLERHAPLRVAVPTVPLRHRGHGPGRGDRHGNPPRDQTSTQAVLAPASSARRCRSNRCRPSRDGPPRRASRSTSSGRSVQNSGAQAGRHRVGHRPRLDRPALLDRPRCPKAVPPP